MTADDVHLFFQEIRYIKKEILALTEAIAEVRSRAERTTILYSQVPTHHSGHKDKVADYSVQLVELGEEMNESLAKLFDSMKQALKMIDLLPDPLDRAVLTEYYVCGKTSEEVAESLEYSSRHVRKLLHDSCVEIAANIPIYMIPEKYQEN